MIGPDGLPDDDLDEDFPLTTPEYHLSDDDVEAMYVEYSTRAPGDWVISGPLAGWGVGPGRRFPNMKAAWAWARDKYGSRLKGRITEATTNSGNRWAFLISGDNHV